MRRKPVPEAINRQLCSTKINTKWSNLDLKKIIFFLLPAILLASGCGKLKGDFAFKKNIEDKYRKIEEPVEFEKNEKINWVYIFKGLRGKHDVGIVLLKKELVWVDIESSVERVSEANNIIYGTIEGLSDGTYKIILADGNKEIDEKEFVIFSDQEDYYQYKDE